MAALYITQAAIIAMVYVIVKNWQIGTMLKGRQSFQSAVLGLYLAIMTVIIIVRYHQVHYLPGRWKGLSLYALCSVQRPALVPWPCLGGT